MPILDRVMGLRRARREAEAGGPAAPTDVEQIRVLERRVAHLEGMVEGLQDAVHREMSRTNQEIEHLRKRLEPAEISRALSENAREHGL
jgi:hypothetical protein